jgi:hypothetical protein
MRLKLDARALVLVALAFYLATVVYWVYGVYDRYPEPSTGRWVIALASLTAAYLFCAFVLSWRALVLPFLMVLISIPAGSRNGDEDAYPVAVAALMIWLTPAIIVVLVGWGIRRALDSPRRTMS